MFFIRQNRKRPKRLLKVVHPVREKERKTLCDLFRLDLLDESGIVIDSHIQSSPRAKVRNRDRPRREEPRGNISDGDRSACKTKAVVCGNKIDRNVVEAEAPLTRELQEISQFRDRKAPV